MTGIISYGAGNIFSLTAALERLGIKYGMVFSERDFEHYDRFIIPGVGHAGAAMAKLRESGLADTVRTLSRPTLGICVGMQLLTAHSEEGDSDMLGLFPLQTNRFRDDPDFKVPHTGWNMVRPERNSPLFEKIPHGSYFYFVHSYFIEYKQAFTLASTDYSVRFSASIWKDNFYGVQFHPEKSGQYGEQLLINFSNL